MQRDRPPLEARALHTLRLIARRRTVLSADAGLLVLVINHQSTAYENMHTAEKQC